MSVEQDMVECPVCDRKIPADSSKCPGCGEDLSMSSFEELEQVARTLSEEKAEPKPEKKAAPPRAEQPKPAAPKSVEKAPENGSSEDDEKKGRFHLFGRKKR
jgi:hypothetical protein